MWVGRADFTELASPLQEWTLNKQPQSQALRAVMGREAVGARAGGGVLRQSPGRRGQHSHRPGRR